MSQKLTITEQNSDSFHTIHLWNYLAQLRKPSVLICHHVDPVRLSLRTSFELEFEFQDIASSKIGCDPMHCFLRKQPLAKLTVSSKI